MTESRVEHVLLHIQNTAALIEIYRLNVVLQEWALPLSLSDLVKQAHLWLLLHHPAFLDFRHLLLIMLQTGVNPINFLPTTLVLIVITQPRLEVLIISSLVLLQNLAVSFLVPFFVKRRLRACLIRVLCGFLLRKVV